MSWPPKVMGVLNITPDSFSDGGDFLDQEQALAHANQMIAAGADIIDIGGESTRPGSERITPQQEQQRVLDAVANIANQFPVSIDTMNSETALKAVANGASFVNDVSGGRADREMFAAVATTNATFILSHWRGHSKDMYLEASYKDVASEVASELMKQVELAVDAGIPASRIVLDPGLGFNKDMGQNWELVARLGELEKLGFGILVGHSRKKFLAGILNSELSEVGNQRRDLATAVLTALLLQHPLWGLRVHNVQATADAIALVSRYREGK